MSFLSHFHHRKIVAAAKTAAEEQADAGVVIAPHVEVKPITPQDIFDQKVKDITAKIEADRDNLVLFHKQIDDIHRNGFTMTTQRHGDFLAVFVTREANKRNKKMMVAINLAKVARISVQPGAPAGKSEGVFVVGDAIDKWVDSQTWENTRMQGERPFTAAQRDAHTYWRTTYNEEYGTIPYVPRPAVDDGIVFHGTDDIILVPFGLGETILNLILQDLSAGYEPADLSKIVEASAS
ncbi:hypothetical protein LAV_00188 [Sphingobium phage Lacusarx]|uniref:Uncharacterized protein n=1 Tax=Sphingobium phage Lacusarx TaxID=1980139 RepID=A0A1W6DXB5_9CAUD|nr:hypothetical protein FDH44_gp115 [Sphingobium phage Lacusarx]ARK07563.1 hypothetical protein LAV_00188 [Sphingobium phage Lacusarx]